MLGDILGAVWSLIKLPFKLIMLPFQVMSFVVSLAIYAVILLAIAGAIWYVFL